MKVEAESSIMLPYGLSRARQKHNNTGQNHNRSLPDEAQRWWVPSLQQLSKSSDGLSGKNLAGSLSKLTVVEVSNQQYRSSTRQTGCPTGTLANDRPNSTTNKPGSLNRKHDSIQLTLHDNVEVVDLSTKHSPYDDGDPSNLTKANLMSAQQKPHPVVRDEVSHQAVHIESVDDHRVTEPLTRSIFPIKTEGPDVIESVHLIDPGILGNKTSTAFLPVRARQFGWATPNLKMDLSDIHDPELQRQVARLMAVYPYTVRYLFDLLIEHEGNYETALRTLQSSNKKNIPRREMPSLISDISNKRIIYSPCSSRLSPLEAPAEHVEQEISHRSPGSVVKKEEEEEEIKYNIMELIGDAAFDIDNDSLEADPNLRTARHRYVSPVKPNQCGKEKSQNNRGVSGNRKPTTPRTNLTPVANMGSKRAQKPRKAKAMAIPKPHPPFSPACVLPRPSRDWSEAYSDVSMASRH
ncbi:hypothetical protein BU24DRAFT_451276 [Aaosphaeria arxii CBS 175.79]|uniref:Uncharacterized protein n=1 Tax=Aaosphaeria arxii CBS 175.79 TaxID=1450172 RepID=A0A6A5XMP3_9PLEO|nr:uncharacterized protein BU24DRAFT_451276 [Aaosphaeria arxii CBS 175.79]KAF2014139.1 hypothetical protein BU24DRAFT_451276 [Aaosphaeria arxii CBS 175.79]